MPYRFTKGLAYTAPEDPIADFWFRGLWDASCAAYVLQNDIGLSLLCGNAAFYAMLGCTKDEMRARYGNRMGALLTVNSLHTLSSALLGRPKDSTAPLHLKLHLRHRETDLWTLTTITCVASPGGTLLCCISYDVTAYEQERHRFSEDEKTLRLATDQLGLDYFEYDLHTHAARLLFAHAVLPPDIVHMGYSCGICPNFVERLLATDFVCTEYKDLFRQAFQDLYKDAGKVVCEVQVQRTGRDIFWVRLSLTVRRNGAEPGRFAAGTLEDITPQKEAARNYLNETRFYQAILAEKDAYAQVDVTRDKITRIGGMWNLYNEVIGKTTYSQLIQEFINKVVHPEDRKHYLEVMQRDNFIQSLRNGIDRLGCEFRRIVDQNKMVWMQLHVHLFYDPLTQHVLALLSIKNINDQKQLEISLLRDSRLDQLTNTFNRRAAETLVREHLTQVSPETLCAFAIVDADNFKEINDTRGHSGGDKVLVRLADILSRTFRRNDVIGRFGGDEFIVFLKNVGDRKNVEERLSTLYTRMREESLVGPILCSTGVALACGSVPYEDFFHRADMALYHAKAAGKNCYRFFQEAPGAAAAKDGGAVLCRPQPQKRRKSDALAAPCKDMQPVAPLATGLAPNSFDAFLGEQGDIAYLVDPENFDLVCGNKAFYDRLGMSEAQCAGIKCYEVMHKRETPCPFCSKANWSSDKFYLWRNLNPTLEQEFLIKNKLVMWRGKEMLLAVAVDISNDKSIVDSMENGAEELHGILSGVQHMADAPTLTAALHSALETIGSFFLADSVRYWKRKPNGEYSCAHIWTCRGKGAADSGAREINIWLAGRKWNQPIMVENPEAMLCHSYEMYGYMKASNIRNQRWMQIRHKDDELGCISIENISSNFRNMAFLESFSVFVTAELKKRALMENAHYADQHDALTDLLSRKSFERYLDAYRPDAMASLGVMMANFNNLKGINSIHGFQAGNYFIRQFAAMLRDIFGERPIFRLNGDEFLAVVPEITRTDMDKYITDLTQLIQGNGAFTVSLGHSWDDVEKDLAVLIEQATTTMKVNKKRHYDAVPALDGAERRRMLSDLMTALEKRDFEIYLQPKVELTRLTVVGAEALIRYNDKDLGVVPPASFIDRLEKNNLIRYIDLFVFEEVCRLLEKWKHSDMFLPVVSLNFSRLTLLERDILASMEDIISRRDAPRTHIEIEITESVADMGKSVIYQAACQLYNAGFAVSLDDFGTKYTNLAMLAELNFTRLKLDKSLTTRLGDRMHTLIMKNIIRMCNELGINVVAEGIETKKQEHILRELNCDMGQGYLYGKPMPVAEFERKHLRPRDEKLLSL